MEKSKQMCFKNKFILLIFFLSLNQTYPQDIQFGGYTKYLLSSFKFHNFDENFTDHTIHSRANLKLFVSDDFTFTSGIRNRIIYGESIEKIPNYSQKFLEDEYSLKLNSFLWQEKKSISFIEIDRFWFDINFNKIQLSLGRQRIAWGTSWVWNITDLFNPLSILDFDYEERPASDGIRIQFYPSITSKIDFATKFGKNKKDFSSAIQFYYNNWEYDFFVLFGYHKLRPVVGVSWSGDILKAGFRGEILLSAPPSSMKLNNQNSFMDENRGQLNIVLSLDYTFKNSFYIHTEFMFNNIGKKDTIGFFTKDAMEIGLLSASRSNLFYQIGYNLSSLSRIDLITLHNPIDNSYALLPTFNYSIMENLDLSLISLFFYGEEFDEFSPSGKMFFIRLKYSF